MGTLTLTQLKAEVKSNMGERDDVDDRLTRALNLAQTRIARSYLWSELRSSVDDNLSFTSTPADDKKYTLPTNVRKLLSVRIIDSNYRSRKLRRLTYGRFDKLIPEPERYTVGIPSVYVRYGATIELWRAPDQAYQILLRLLIWPTAFSDGDLSATSTLEQKDDMLIALATAYLNNSFGKEQRAAYWWRIYRRMFEEAKENEDSEPDLDITPSADIPVGPPEYWKDPFIKGF